MIRIHRGSEEESCPALAEVRERELARVRVEIANDVRLDNDVLGREYKVARDALATAQHYKCCYCEQHQQSVKWKPVEHYRPKSKYWWLTWTWDNLLFSCEQCNGSKLADFEIEAGSTRLQPEQQPPGNERPLPLHPAQDDPREHIEFIPTGNKRWIPRPRGGSARGRATLDALCWSKTPDDMPKPGLLEMWKERAADLDDCVTAIESAIETNDAERVRQTWTQSTTRYRYFRKPFVALSLDILDRHFPEHVRRRWGLSLDVIYDP
jgi:uncharacterized protein (TIGR02646 family)